MDLGFLLTHNLDTTFWTLPLPPFAQGICCSIQRCPSLGRTRRQWQGSWKEAR